MPTYEKLPARIEAWEFTGEPERTEFLIDWMDGYGTDAVYVGVGEAHPARKANEFLIQHDFGPGPSIVATSHVVREDAPAFLSIRTLEGWMRSNPGDMVIRGVEDEFYSCERGIFKKTYRLVDVQPNDESL